MKHWRTTLKALQVRMIPKLYGCGRNRYCHALDMEASLLQLVQLLLLPPETRFSCIHLSGSHYCQSCSEVATVAKAVLGELSVVLIFSSIVKDLLGMGVGLTSRPSQYVQVQLQGERENKHMACSALRVGGSSESIWEELYHQGVGNGQFPSLIAQTLIQYF